MTRKLIGILAFGMLVIGPPTWNLVLADNAIRPPLELSLRSLKPSYLLGELVRLELEIKNTGTTDVSVDSCNTEISGYRVLISRDGRKFYEYLSPNLEAKTKRRLLKAGESCLANKTVLVNGIPPTSHLSASARKQSEDRRISTILAFPDAAEYYVKVAVLAVDLDGAVSEESAAIKLPIVAPVGEELLAWRMIKDRADFAYFSQQGEPTSEVRTNTQRFLSEVDAILRQYPRTRYALQLGESQARYDLNERKRQELLNKIHRP